MSQQIAATLPNFNFGHNKSASKIWPVWSNSVRSEVRFSPISSKKRNLLWYSARKWDQKTRIPGKHGGILGRSALAVLHALLFDFLNTKTGRLDPSIATIARAASVCERTANTALQRLKSLGILAWQRRCEGSHNEGKRFVLRQRSNAYAPLTRKSWIGFRESEPPAPSRDTLGFPPPYPDPLQQAIDGITAADRVAVRQALALEPDDPLARALAALGRAVGAI